MIATEWIGSAAATLTTTAFIPQAWQVWRTRHTAGISLGRAAGKKRFHLPAHC